MSGAEQLGHPVEQVASSLDGEVQVVEIASETDALVGIGIFVVGVEQHVVIRLENPSKYVGGDDVEVTVIFVA